MNRTNICKNIVQSIKDYITDQVKLEPHRVEKPRQTHECLSTTNSVFIYFLSF